MTLWLHPNALATIIVTDGPINPAYPGGNPDPWNAGASLELDESTLSIDAGSLVTATTLFIDGRVLVNSAGLLDVDTTTILTGPGGSNSGAAFHLDAGNVDAGSFSVEDSAVLYIGAENGGVFSTQSAGGIGASSTVVISLDDGAQFIGVGNTTFGGNSSSFSLGPSPTDPAGFAPDLASVTTLVTTAKATVADAAMNNIAAAQGGSGIAGLGNDSVFQVTGDMSIGGTSSDALVHINDSSQFNVTGSLTFPGLTSISTLAVVEADFDVGNDLNILNADGSSATLVLYNATFDVGGEFNTAGPASSVFTLTANNTPVSVAGAAQLTVGDGSAMDLTLTNSSPAIGGSLITGNALGTNNALSVVQEDSDFSIAGDMQMNIGDSSVMNGDFTGGSVDTAGEFRFNSLGAGSTITLNVDGTDFTTGGSLVLERVGSNSSTSFSLQDLAFDITDDLQVTVTGAGSDSLLLMQDISGQIGRDFSLLTGISDSVSNHVMVRVNLSIARDFTYRVTETAPPPTGQPAWFVGNSSFTVTRDFVLEDFVVANFVDTALNADGSIDIEGELEPDNVTITGNVNLAPSGTLRIAVPPAGTSGQAIDITGDLSLSAGSNVVLELEGTTPNTVFEPIIHSGPNPVSLSGDLILAFPDGMSAAALMGQSIPLITSSLPIAGAFANVMVGQAVPTAGGVSSYILLANDTGDTLFLQAGARTIPTLGTWTLMLLILLVALSGAACVRGQWVVSGNPTRLIG